MALGGWREAGCNLKIVVEATERAGKVLLARLALPEALPSQIPALAQVGEQFLPHLSWAHFGRPSPPTPLPAPFLTFSCRLSLRFLLAAGVPNQGCKPWGFWRRLLGVNVEEGEPSFQRTEKLFRAYEG